MSITTIQEKALDAYGPILIKKGYEWVDLSDVSEAAGVDPEELELAFPSKALICESWMELTDERTKRHHEKILSSDKSKRDVLDTYFKELETFMTQHGFGGCPFTNTSRALRGRSEPKIQQRITEHKSEVRNFFLRLCNPVTLQPEIVGEALFLIYSGATTESANLQNMKPVLAGRQAALALFDTYEFKQN